MSPDEGQDTAELEVETFLVEQPPSFVRADLDDYVTTLQSYASSQIGKHGRVRELVTALAVCREPNRTRMHVIHPGRGFRNRNMLEFIDMARQLIMVDGEVFAAFTVGEIWIVEMPHDNPDRIDLPAVQARIGLPSKHPERREAVCIAGDSPNLCPNRVCWIARITRTVDGANLEQPWKRTDGALNAAARLLPEYPRTDGRADA